MTTRELEYEKAKQLRKIGEERITAESISDFTVKRYADGLVVSSAEGSLIEIALLVVKGLHEIEKQYPEARSVFAMVLSEYGGNGL